MKHLIRFLAGVGALAVVLIVYSSIRSPQGTLQAAMFMGVWWIDPFIQDQPDLRETFPDIITNPDRTEVADTAIEGDYTLALQDEAYANFLGDGHCIVIAKLREKSRMEFPPSSVDWVPFAQSGTELTQFLREATPYSDHSNVIDPFLNDPDALISIRDLRRSGETISNLRIFIASPKQQALLEWGADF